MEPVVVPSRSPRGRMRERKVRVKEGVDDECYSSIATDLELDDPDPCAASASRSASSPEEDALQSAVSTMPPTNPLLVPSAKPEPVADSGNASNPASAGNSRDAEHLPAARAMSRSSIDTASTVDVMQKTPETMKEKLYCLLEPGMPAWSRESQRVQTFLSIAVFVVIVVSVMTFCIESLPQYYNRQHSTLQYIEGTCVLIFTVEVLIRVTCCPLLNRFIRDPMNWIDFISIIPWYITLIFTYASGGSGGGAGSLVVFRVIRLIRVFRVFKLSKYSRNLQLVAVAVARSLDALTLLLFLICISLLLFSSMVFLADQTVMDFNNETNTWTYYDDDKDEERNAPFQSIPHAFWWCIVTLTTVGYGDDVPISWPGKFIAAIAMLCGLLVAAFPVVLIGNNFNEALAEQKTRQKRQQAELVSRMLGQEPAQAAAASGGRDEAPDQEVVAAEIDTQLTRLKTELEGELSKLGVELSCLSQRRRDNRHGLPLGTNCATFVFNGIAQTVYITSYGQHSDEEAEPKDPNRGFPGIVNSGAMPLRVLVRKFNERVRIMEKARDSKEKASVSFQFRYEPIYHINNIYSTSRNNPVDVSEEDEDDAARAQHLMLIEVFLDTDAIRKLAHLSLVRTGEFPRLKLTNVCANPLRYLTATIPGLQVLCPTVQVSCEQEHPRRKIFIKIEAPDVRTLLQAEALLPKLSLSFESSSQFSGDTLTTVPLGAHQRLFEEVLPLPGVRPVFGRSSGENVAEPSPADAPAAAQPPSADAKA